MDSAKAQQKYEARLRAIAEQFGVDVELVRERSSGGVIIRQASREFHQGPPQSTFQGEGTTA